MAYLKYEEYKDKSIDFETYYDQDYSLSKLTTEEYVRSDLFETIGVSVKVNEDPGCWYSGAGVHTFLNSLDYSDKAILCHNAVFDGAILSWIYNIKPKFWFDTLSMSRPKHNATVGTCRCFVGNFLATFWTIDKCHLDVTLRC